MNKTITLRFIITIIIIIIVCSFISCIISGINSVIINRETGQKQWITNNILLQGFIEIKEINFKLDGEVLKVYILLLNKKNRTIGTEIKVDFFDREGFPLDNYWGWQPIILEPRQEEWVKYAAPRTEDMVSKIKVMIQKITEN